MKRNTQAILALAATLATAVTFSVASAENHMDNMEHSAKGGLGFRSSDAPIGMRWWFNNQVGLDLGVGFTSEKINYADFTTGDPADESFSTFSVDVGLPWALKRWDKVHFLLRPGVFYTTQDDVNLFFASDGVLKEKLNTISVTGEFELEVFLAKNASVSASHGVGFVSQKLDISGQEADTIFGTFGSNFTTLGFHVYLWQ